MTICEWGRMGYFHISKCIFPVSTISTVHLDSPQLPKLTDTYFTISIDDGRELNTKSLTECMADGRTVI